MTFKPKFHVNKYNKKVMRIEDYDMLTCEQKQELDRNYWIFDYRLQGYFEFEEMTDDEKVIWANEKMKVWGGLICL